MAPLQGQRIEQGPKRTHEPVLRRKLGGGEIMDGVAKRNLVIERDLEQPEIKTRFAARDTRERKIRMAYRHVSFRDGLDPIMPRIQKTRPLYLQRKAQAVARNIGNVGFGAADPVG